MCFPDVYWVFGSAEDLAITYQYNWWTLNIRNKSTEFFHIVVQTAWLIGRLTALGLRGGPRNKGTRLQSWRSHTGMSEETSFHYCIFLVLLESASSEFMPGCIFKLVHWFAYDSTISDSFKCLPDWSGSLSGRQDIIRSYFVGICWFKEKWSSGWSKLYFLNLCLQFTFSYSTCMSAPIVVTPDLCPPLPRHTDTHTQRVDLCLLHIASNKRIAIRGLKSIGIRKRR